MDRLSSAACARDAGARNDDGAGARFGRRRKRSNGCDRCRPRAVGRRPASPDAGPRSLHRRFGCDGRRHLQRAPLRLHPRDRGAAVRATARRPPAARIAGAAARALRAASRAPRLARRPQLNSSRRTSHPCVRRRSERNSHEGERRIMRSIRTAVCAGALALALTPTAALAGGDPVSGTLDQVQQATNSNSTSQSADSTATTKQANVNAPVSVLSKGSNNGDVDQSNDAPTGAASGNSNGTYQSNDQDQHGSVQGGGSSSCGCDQPNGGSNATQDQSASNQNETKQDASSEATTKQVNVNAPVSVLSKDSNNGDVNQSNDAKTIAKSENENNTTQSNDQEQNGWVGGSRKGGASLSQSQDASNENKTNHSDSSEA